MRYWKTRLKLDEHSNCKLRANIGKMWTLLKSSIQIKKMAWSRISLEESDVAKLKNFSLPREIFNKR